MRKLFLIILPLLLVGCATVAPPIFVTTTQMSIQPTPEAVYLESSPSSTIPLINEHPTHRLESLAVPKAYFNPDASMISNGTGIAASTEKVAIIPIIKKAVKVVKSIKDAVSDEKLPDTPLAEAKASPPLPAPIPSPTGAKIQILGIDLEFWVGNNDSWSTVWKLIVLVLFVYGGLRLINLLIQRGEKALAV